MSMTVATATARLSRQMPEAEAAIDDALVASAELLLTAAAARRDTGARGSDAHAALLRLSKLNQTLIEAAAEARRAHTHLRRIGEDPSAINDENDCPPSAVGGTGIAAVA